MGTYNYSANPVYVHLALIEPQTNVDYLVGSDEYLLDRLSSSPDNYSLLVISNYKTCLISNVKPNISSNFFYSEDKFTSNMYYLELP